MVCLDEPKSIIKTLIVISFEMVVEVLQRGHLLFALNHVLVQVSHPIILRQHGDIIRVFETLAYHTLKGLCKLF